MHICVVGSGYVGMVTGAGFSETGHSVTCVDLSESKINDLQKGIIPIFEPGLEALVHRNTEAGRLSFSTDVAGQMAKADIVFVCVGTPMREDGGANLAAVDTVAEQFAKHVTREAVLICKSTVPVGTNARVRKIVKGAPHPIHVVANPEFLKEGDAVNDFLRPDRIVIGCDEDDKFARGLMERLYHPVSLNRNRIIWMDPESAELTKYVANTMLAMRISFMNEIAALCDKVGADVHKVRTGVGSDTRIGSKFLYAGPGYGGSCFPKDVTALVHTGREHGLELELASATDRVNQRQKATVYRKLKKILNGDVRGKEVAIWGVAFKPRTDDIRQSPALNLIDALLADGAKVRVHDPEALGEAKKRFGDRILYAEGAYQAIEDADALVLITEWRQYQNPDFKRIQSLMKTPALFDARNIWSGYGLRAQGFQYHGIGVIGS